MEISKEAYMRQLEAEGWEVSAVQLDEIEFPQIVTTTVVTATTTLTEAIRISPPSGAEVRLFKGDRLWLYIGAGAAELLTVDKIAITRQRANADENRLASGIYDSFDNRDDETVWRWQRNVKVLPADRLLIKIAPTVTTTQTLFSMDALILIRKGEGGV
ncbi:hypothetical protein LCGC14_0926550 [marine sediment metagenome]|uniref:Uncharacterized protein n=1 Tax=marine sediment metagenome TaxID=412755 RepID=A0A0F9RVW7_9ZZZZ